MGTGRVICASASAHAARLHQQHGVIVETEVLAAIARLERQRVIVLVVPMVSIAAVMVATPFGLVVRVVTPAAAA
jgi:hypothetical protein